MDRGAWQAIVHGVPELDSTEQLTIYIYVYIYPYFLLYRKGNIINLLSVIISITISIVLLVPNLLPSPT